MMIEAKVHQWDWESATNAYMKTGVVKVSIYLESSYYYSIVMTIYYVVVVSIHSFFFYTLT